MIVVGAVKLSLAISIEVSQGSLPLFGSVNPDLCTLLSQGQLACLCYF